ncbi:hypothetical protein VC83_06915 [Pseudogymnoascus destructans]|uniref:Histone-lysine N-methyltransferase, H3 lysine-9 specific dim-5 n=2 Tax=Pseudogymnoascus destructans TaxID=655981 RepID=L8FYF4_PSED2|nr:uncharacterized protein VC83_06915 [Pseudogymnoascus destructans]ELR04721.1 hypothetical protein GMDG_06950 [Pseudogymnoascus destructans 20631-21]OAF56828.1 hypothetical protein VC83_06915 [Pseudogymnoascus destructans]
MVKVKRAPKSMIGVNRGMVARARALSALLSTSHLQLSNSKTRPQPRDDRDRQHHQKHPTKMPVDDMRERHRLYHGTTNPAHELDLSVLNTKRHISRHPSIAKVQNQDESDEVVFLYDTKSLEKEKGGCNWCELASFTTHSDYPVTVTNNVDNARFPEGFHFIEHSILREGVARADAGFRMGCECVEDGDCEFRGCYCIQDMEAKTNKLGQPKKANAYLSKGPKAGCLRKDILDSRLVLYECHESCACSKNCINRIVEQGRKVPLEIFRTSDGRGWGVRSSVTIKEGQFVDKYVGEIITSAEAQRRREDSRVAQRKDIYLFALDKFSDPDSIDERLSGPCLEVDGEFMAGPTRFINHSCDPNLRIFARVGDHADKHIHDLAFFAIHDIPAGEELTFDYVDGLEGDLAEDGKVQKHHKDMTECLCGAPECRKFLW